MGDQENESSVWFICFSVMMVDHGALQDTPILSRTCQANEYCSVKTLPLFHSVSLDPRSWDLDESCFTSEKAEAQLGEGSHPRSHSHLVLQERGWGSGCWLSKWKRAWGFLE